MSGRDPDRRRALLDAADRVIMREGPEVSMAAIAAEAGITKPILYRHFGDKRGLYQALADRHVRTVIGRLRPRLADPGGDLRGRARATIGVYLDLISANLNLYRFLFHRAGAEDSRVRSHMTSLVRNLGEELGGLLTAERVVPDPVRAQVLGHAFVGMVQTTGDWWLDHPEVDRTQVVEGLVDVIAAAITPRTGRAARGGGRGRAPTRTTPAPPPGSPR
ncbi:DNA-binding transcriptional regulator, AcrR family [Nonomuraea solani]|uniref:DNA-binding transcriptional regulator, AcrR family n=1 Tax=Nonomuraea solani TaxID=1144553 RepID=A0A1H6EZQ1_9ACTN|nr:TetR family transcriptional regulator [Nonomuraea solani]SEH03377.1 DNA-binding transcriptional regulator, AcrR family [Nonomuraea solani]